MVGLIIIMIRIVVVPVIFKTSNSNSNGRGMVTVHEQFIKLNEQSITVHEFSR